MIFKNKSEVPYKRRPCVVLFVICAVKGLLEIINITDKINRRTQVKIKIDY